MIDSATAYITIIQFLVQVVKYGNKKLRKVLTHTAFELEKFGSNLDLTESKNILSKNLKAKFGVTKGTMIWDELHFVEPILHPVANYYHSTYVIG